MSGPIIIPAPSAWSRSQVRRVRWPRKIDVIDSGTLLEWYILVRVAASSAALTAGDRPLSDPKPRIPPRLGFQRQKLLRGSLNAPGSTIPGTVMSLLIYILFRLVWCPVILEYSFHVAEQVCRWTKWVCLGQLSFYAPHSRSFLCLSLFSFLSFLFSLGSSRYNQR